MTVDAFKDIEKLENDLWAAADNLRANSGLTSSEYFLPVLGVIFLRHAANRFEAATRQIEADQAAGRMPKRKVTKADYLARGSMWLPEPARYDWIMENASVSAKGLPKLVTDAMTTIEAEYEPLKEVLPKDYGIFEPAVLEDLMRRFNSEQIRQASGDVFGRLNEYFLAQFSAQKAYDNGEFFTPPSIVQTIVNVIEPDHGVVLDPAAGSGGMFVQSSYFIVREGEDPNRRALFFGHEKSRETIRIAKMNLAVHGLDGKIAEAITYYDDPHSLAPKQAMAPGGCDFVMANPPFNVDMVDAERVKGDTRLPFGLPGISKGNGRKGEAANGRKGTVSNGNYLWISYFWSYLNETGRAGFVMSSQASSAGHGERDVRRKIVETGDVDVMISIRSNFFYTRTVPCELWFFDRGKPKERQDVVLMLDARNVYRKVTRKINDFSLEQLANLSAIVWLYRGQRERFLALVRDYLAQMCKETTAVADALAPFGAALDELSAQLTALRDAVEAASGLDPQQRQELLDAAAEFTDASTLLAGDRAKTLAELAAFVRRYASKPPKDNAGQHAARGAFDPIAESLRGLVRQVDLVSKLAARVADQGSEIAKSEVVAAAYDRRAAGRLLKQLDETRKDAIEQLKRPVYFHRQVAWLQERFPDAALRDVPGLVKLVARAEIEAADWSLTPGRYVGVAPPEEDEEVDFEQTMREIHTELVDLSTEAVELAAMIQGNLQELFP
jgi:type I restriction enzyme M protein